ncbi:hypothetical protein BH23PLA1_BH23PLA1_42110 [soil metagenome]
MSSELRAGEGQSPPEAETGTAEALTPAESLPRAAYESQRPSARPDVEDPQIGSEPQRPRRRWPVRLLTSLLIATPLAFLLLPKRTRRRGRAEEQSQGAGAGSGSESGSARSEVGSADTTEAPTPPESPPHRERSPGPRHGNGNGNGNGNGRPRHPRPAFRGGETLPALRMVETPRSARVIGKFIWSLIIILPFAMLWLPWRQSVSGNGRVIGFHPLDRSFTVRAPFNGRVVEFLVNEGDFVNQGDLITQIQDIDPQYLETLKLQRELTQDQLGLAEDSVLAYENVVQRLEEARVQQLEAARAGVDVAEQRIEEVARQQDETNVSRAAARQKRERWQRLFDQGLVSRQEAEFAERDYLELEARLRQLAALLQSAQIGRAAAEARLQEVDARTISEIQKAQADFQASQAQARSIDNQLEDYNIQIRRQETQMVYSPRAGTVLRLLTNVEAGAQVKEGDPLLILIPQAREIAAEVYLLGRDIPLVQPGDPVRLQFDGWPAVQFVGWPSVAIGTFGGRVAVVDNTPTHQGLFRVLVLPDPESHTDWPTQRFLRQGAQVRGWVLLREVSLGFEIWRRINGFPPIVAFDEPTGEDDYANPRVEDSQSQR